MIVGLFQQVRQRESTTMAERDSMTIEQVVRKVMSDEHADVLRESLGLLARELMESEVSELVGAGHGERKPAGRLTQRNGYRRREWDTRAGVIELEIPKLRQGSYFPHALLEPRKRGEQALLSVIQQAYVCGVSTRRVDQLARDPKAVVRGVRCPLEQPLAVPALARLVGPQHVLEPSHVRSGLDAVEVEGLDDFDVLENVAELGGHALDLLVGEVQPRQPGDVQDLVAIDHERDSRLRAAFAVRGPRTAPPPRLRRRSRVRAEAVGGSLVRLWVSPCLG